MRKNYWLKTLNQLRELGWDPSPSLLEYANEHNTRVTNIILNELDKPVPWYRKVYYKLSRVYNEVWDYRFGNPRWYKRKWTLLTKGYDPSDCWSLDHSFCKWIVPRLKHLKESKHGVPGFLVNGEDGESFAKGETLWNEQLDKMIWAFEFYQHELAEFCDPNGPQWKKFHEGFYAFKIYFGCLWD